MVTTVETVPPIALTEPDAGENPTVSRAAACVTANDAEAPPAITTTAPDRSEDNGFSEAVTDSETPLVPEVRLNVTHDGEEDTDHDAWLVVTVVLTDPPRQ